MGFNSAFKGLIIYLVGCTAITLNPLRWKIWWAPNNDSRWQMGFNSAFKGLIIYLVGCTALTLNPLRWKIWRAPNNDSRWQMGFNSAFKGLIIYLIRCTALTLNPLRWKIWWARNNDSRWQIGFNSAFKWLNANYSSEHYLRNRFLRSLPHVVQEIGTLYRKIKFLVIVKLRARSLTHWTCLIAASLLIKMFRWLWRRNCFIGSEVQNLL